VRLFSGPQIDEVTLREQVQAEVKALSGELPDRDALRSLTDRHGIDHATALLHEALLASPHGELLRRLERRGLGLAVPPHVHVLVAPTMFWREHPEIGGDGRLVVEVARRLGLRAEVAPTRSLGSVEENAPLLLEALGRLDGEVWLVSLSRGSLDLKRAFAVGRGGPELRRVRAWVNISGIVGGSPLIDRAGRTPLHRLFFELYLRLRGGQGAAFFDMARSSAAAQAPLHVPPGIEVLNVVPLPLPSHLSRATLKHHRRLAVEGPNDGFVAFRDAVAPGAIVPVWGADHYLRTPALSPLVYRILGELAERAAPRQVRIGA
jgi:hypothetical protein